MEVKEVTTEYENGELDIKTQGLQVFKILEVIKELPDKLFSGAIVTETIFSWQGMGLLFINGVNDRDYFILMGLILITSTLVVFFNLIADIAYAIVDPRIRYD